MQHRHATLAAVFALLFLGFPAAGPPSALAAEARSCTQAEREDADRRLFLNKADKQRAIDRHLPWGVPQPAAPIANETLLVHRDYVINYSLDLLVPVWTAHKLDAKGLGKLERVNCFRRDPRINAPAASLLAYTGASHARLWDERPNVPAVSGSGEHFCSEYYAKATRPRMSRRPYLVTRRS